MSRRPLLVALSALTACGSGPADFVLELPPRPGPPAVLARLEGQRTSRVLETLPDARRNGEVQLRGADVTLSIGQDRVADISVRYPTCETIKRYLDAWGPPARREPTLWADRTTRWVAELRDIPGQCTLLFTSADYFGAPGSIPDVFGAAVPGGGLEALQSLEGFDTKGDSRYGSARSIPFASAGIELDPRGERIREMGIVLPARAVAALRMAWGPAPAHCAAGDVWEDTRHARVALLQPESGGAPYQQLAFRPMQATHDTALKILEVARDPELWTTPIEYYARTHARLDIDTERPAVWTLDATPGSCGRELSVTFGGIDGAPTRMRWSLHSPDLTVLDAFGTAWGPPKQLSADTWTFERISEAIVRKRGDRFDFEVVPTGRD